MPGYLCNCLVLAELQVREGLVLLEVVVCLVTEHTVHVNQIVIVVWGSRIKELVKITRTLLKRIYDVIKLM